MKLSRTLLLTYFFLLFSVSGCSFFASLFVKSPEITGIKKVGISDISFTEVEFNVTLEVLNENNFNADVKQARYKLYLNDEYVGKGITDKSQTIYSNKISDLELPLRIKYSDLPPTTVNLIKDIISGKKVLYRVEGDVDAEAEGFSATIPVDIEKELTAFKN